MKPAKVIMYYGDMEKPYNFSSVRNLVQDFYADIELLTGERP